MRQAGTSGSLSPSVCYWRAAPQPRLIERWFGPVFKLENVSCVLGFLGATAVGTFAAAVSGTAVVAISEPTADILNVWRGWFTSGALGIVTVAPLPIGLASAMRRAPPRREQIEGAAAPCNLVATSAFVISLHRDLGQRPCRWPCVPIVLWIAVRCRPVFAAAAALIVALIVVCSTALALVISVMRASHSRTVRSLLKPSC